VHGSPSSQLIGTKEHLPVEETQESFVQAELSLQAMGVSGTQLPLVGAHTWGRHLLVAVQTTTTGVLHLVQSGTEVLTQRPFWQAPVMQPSPVLQSMALLVHPIVVSQESIVHGLPSLHEAEMLVKTQPVAGAQESLVQALWSLQVMRA
jgi:hypothetical protein